MDVLVAFPAALIAELLHAVQHRDQSFRLLPELLVALARRTVARPFAEDPALVPVYAPLQAVVVETPDLRRVLLPVQLQHTNRPAQQPAQLHVVPVARVVERPSFRVVRLAVGPPHVLELDRPQRRPVRRELRQPSPELRVQHPFADQVNDLGRLPPRGLQKPVSWQERVDRVIEVREGLHQMHMYVERLSVAAIDAGRCVLPVFLEELVEAPVGNVAGGGQQCLGALSRHCQSGVCRVCPGVLIGRGRTRYGELAERVDKKAVPVDDLLPVERLTVALAGPEVACPGGVPKVLQDELRALQRLVAEAAVAEPLQMRSRACVDHPRLADERFDGLASGLPVAVEVR